MANLVLYRSHDDYLGDVAKGRWREMRRLLPALIEYLNLCVRQDWTGGLRRNVVASTAGFDPSTPPQASPPLADAFALDVLLQDESEAQDEIFIQNADELVRLFDWFAFLRQRDGAAELYGRLVDDLRRITSGIERFKSAPASDAG